MNVNIDYHIKYYSFHVSHLWYPQCTQLAFFLDVTWDRVKLKVKTGVTID